MKLSIYTFVKNGIYQDYHVVEMLKHHLPFADEIIVNEGYSNDGTYEAISNLDPKIKIFRTKWGKAKDINWFVKFKNDARERCTGDWCLLLDCDELIPEWEWERIRNYMETTNEQMAPFKLINFYGNYQVYHTDPAKVVWPYKKMMLHRNVPNIQVWGDGSNVGFDGTETEWSVSNEEFICHHFGFVRHAGRLRQKWRWQGEVHAGKRRWFQLPSFLFNWMPHKWDDPHFLSDLAIYEGPHCQAVRDNPDEFIRDNNRLLDLLKKEQ